MNLHRLQRPRYAKAGPTPAETPRPQRRQTRAATSRHPRQRECAITDHSHTRQDWATRHRGDSHPVRHPESSSKSEK